MFNITEYAKTDYTVAQLVASGTAKATIHLMDLNINDARRCAKEYARKGYDVDVTFSDAGDKTIASFSYDASAGFWVDNFAPDHKCVIQETPDGMGCVTCLYH